MRKLFTLIMVILITFVLTSCSGEAGNDHFDLSRHKQPEAYYNLIYNNQGYELVGIDENFIGGFVVEPFYNDPNDPYGYLPVLKIADGAFKNRITIFQIIILKNIYKIGSNAFEGWRGYQNIFFQIEKDQSFLFDTNWNTDSKANLTWGVDEYDLKEFFGIDDIGFDM